MGSIPSAGSTRQSTVRDIQVLSKMRSSAPPTLLNSELGSEVGSRHVRFDSQFIVEENHSGSYLQTPGLRMIRYVD